MASNPGLHGQAGAPRTSDASFRAVFEQVAVGMLLCDAHGALVLVNPCLCEMLGYTCEELIRLGEAGVTHPGDLAKDRELLGQLVAGDIPHYHLEKRYLRKDGGVLWGQLTMTARCEDGGITGIVGVVQDVTERKRAEELLRQREERYALVERAIHEGVWDWDLGTDRAYLSPQWKALLGFRDDELPNHASSFFGHVHPDDREEVGRAIDRHLTDGAPYDLELRLRHKDGSYRWMRTRGEALRDVARRPIRMVGAIVDVTERLEASRHIAEQSQLLDQIFQHTLDNLVILDRDYTFLRVSETYARGCGIPVADLLGKNHFEVFPSSFEEEHAPFRLGKRTYHRSERPFVFPEHPEWGTTYWDVGMVPILDEAGEIARFIFTLKDVTDSKRAELRSAESLREKEVLLREIHHRVKNNLQVISSLLHFQGEKAGSPEVLAAFAEVRRRLVAMSLVHETLYQATQLSSVDLGGYVRSLVLAIGASFDHDRVVAVDVPAERIELPLDVAMPVGMILCELLTNVHKYAWQGRAAGTAHVTVRPGADEIAFAVEDDGVGLPPGFDARSARSFGWRLIRLLVAQCEGRFEISTEGGVRVRFLVPWRGARADGGPA